MIQKEIEDLYHFWSGNKPEQIEKLPGAGSNREYFRIYGSPEIIAVHGSSIEENSAFIYLSSFLKEKELPVPQVYTHSKDKRFYLQEDLGDSLLFDLIKTGRESGIFNPEEQSLLKRTLEILPSIQFAGQKGLDYNYCYPQPSFNRRSVFWDLNYFKYYFLKTSGIEFQEDKLEDDFEQMCDKLLAEPFETFMYRDFQSRNVMVKNDKLYFIDFQGGRKGPVYYDIASFLWQAKANYPDELKEELLQTYLKAITVYKKIDEVFFRSQLKHFVLFRTLQVLGAYGFRGIFEKKAHFIQSIPFALNNLKKVLSDGFPEYPYLADILKQLTETYSIEKVN